MHSDWGLIYLAGESPSVIHISSHRPAVVPADAPDADAADGLSVKQSLAQRVDQVHGVVLQDHQHVFALLRRTMSAQTAAVRRYCPVRYWDYSRYQSYSDLDQQYGYKLSEQHCLEWKVENTELSDVW